MLDEGEVDRVVDCKPQAVCECGGQVEVADALQRHQVFEVPPMRAQVDEYRLYRVRCAGCGKLHAGVLPVAEAAASLCTANALWMDETRCPREGMGNWV